MQISDLTRLLLRQFTADGKASATTAKSQIRHVCRLLGDFEAEDVSAADVQEYQLTRQREGAAPATIRNELICLRSAYRLGKQFGCVSSTPHISTPKVQNARLVFCSSAQFEAIHGYLEPRSAVLADLVAFLWLTGWRSGQTKKLLWSMIDFEAGLIVATDAITKNDEPHSIPMSSALRAILERRLGDRSGEFVFQRRGKPIGRLGVLWDRAVEDVAPGLVPHDLRRSAARELVPICGEQVTMEICGWKSVEMLHRYRIVDESTKLGAMEERAAP